MILTSAARIRVVGVVLIRWHILVEIVHLAHIIGQQSRLHAIHGIIEVMISWRPTVSGCFVGVVHVGDLRFQIRHTSAIVQEHSTDDGNTDDQQRHAQGDAGIIRCGQIETNDKILYGST